MSAANPITRVLAGNVCSGCGLCQAMSSDNSVSVEMAADGYLRPRQNAPLSEEESRIIGATCPGLRIDQSSTNGREDPIWGPILECRTAYASDPDLRYRASSGGALSALVTHLLRSGRVDGVLQTAADGESPIDNASVLSRTDADVFQAAGSRYAPSAPLAEIDRHLESQGVFAFVGKPCDVAALRALSRIDPRVDAKIPVMIAFFCAGIPSRSATLHILDRLGVSERDVASFRYRGDGWPGFATATTRDGRQPRMSYADSWGGILTHQLQFRCKICPDGSGGAADVVCADAWYGDDSGYPLFEEADGRSLMLSRTEAGEDLVRSAMAAGAIVAEDVDIGEIARMQPYQAKRRMLTLSRLAALTLCGRITPRYTGLHLVRAALRAGLFANARSFLGMLRRIVLPKPL